MNWEDASKKLLEYIEATKDFMLENAPPLFTELIAFSRAWLTCIEAICLLGIILMPILFCKSLKKYEQAKYDEGGRYSAYMIISAFLFVPSFIAFFVNIRDFFMVWFAPKIYLIHFLTGK